MKLVVDANVVMSALARDSGVRTALRTTPDDVCTPWYIAVDTLYAAAALAVDGAVVSNDQAFEKQQTVLDDGEVITVRPDGWVRGQLVRLETVRDDLDRALEGEDWRSRLPSTLRGLSPVDS